MPQTSKMSLSWMAMTIIFANMGLAVVLAWAFLQFGSLSAAVGYMAGDRVLPDSREKSFGTADRGRDSVVRFDPYNWTHKPVTLVGASSSCTCVVAQDLPVTVAPSSKVALTIKVRTSARLGQIMESLKVYTDYAGQPTISLKVFGMVHEGTRS